MMNPQHLTQTPFFVYGTLLPGQPNFYLWGDRIVSMEDGVLHNGRLHDLGNYPMLIEATDHQVHGKLVTVQAVSYQTIVQRLDFLEGFDPKQPNASAYRRLKREVEGTNGRLINAWVYIGQEPYVFGMPPVESGDWATYIANRMDKIQHWWTTIDSVADLHNLKTNNY